MRLGGLSEGACERGFGAMEVGGLGAHGMRGRGERGQMAVELAALIPVIVVVALTAYNLMRYVELCAVFDRVALDAVISQGVAPAGEQEAHAAASAVQACIAETIASSACTVEVSVSSPHEGSQPGRLSILISPLLTRYTCTLHFRPWPSAFVLAGVVYDSPVTLVHTRSLVVDRFRPGVVG